MADRYWVTGGSGVWDNADTSNWSTTPGGASGASVPTAADSVFFDRTGTYSVNIEAPGTCLDFTVSAGTVTFVRGLGDNITVSGNLSIISTTLIGNAGGPLTINLAATTSKTITTNGGSIYNITFNGVGGSWALQDALTIPNTTTLTNGTLNLQSYTLTTTIFSSANTNARTVAFGTGNITLVGTLATTIWNTNTSTNFTTSGTQVVNVASTATSGGVTVATGNLSEANSMSFNFTTGTYSLSLIGNNSYRNLNFTGFAGTVGIGALIIYGDLTLSAASTLTATTNAWTFGATSTGKTITTNGKTIDRPLTFNGVGGSWILQDALTMGSTRQLAHTNGTLDLNGKTLTVGSSYSTAVGTKNLTFNGGTLICPAVTTQAFNNASPAGFTTTAGTGTGTISMTGATAKTFVGGGSTYNCTVNQGGAGTLTITGNNTFNNITNTVQPASVLFTAGTTTTFNNFNLSGTAGNLITIGSVTAASHTLSKSSGTVSSDYLSISRSTATGGATWYAGANSTDGLNNTGWLFTAAPSVIPGVSLPSGLTIGNGITFSV